MNRLPVDNRENTKLLPRGKTSPQQSKSDESQEKSQQVFHFGMVVEEHREKDIYMYLYVGRGLKKQTEVSNKAFLFTLGIQKQMGLCSGV